jgi:hypothetical protein
VVEGARLESEYTSKAYRGFESLPLRHAVFTLYFNMLSGVFAAQIRGIPLQFGTGRIPSWRNFPRICPSFSAAYARSTDFKNPAATAAAERPHQRARHLQNSQQTANLLGFFRPTGISAWPGGRPRPRISVSCSANSQYPACWEFAGACWDFASQRPRPPGRCTSQRILIQRPKPRKYRLTKDLRDDLSTASMRFLFQATARAAMRIGQAASERRAFAEVFRSTFATQRVSQNCILENHHEPH